MASDSDDDSSSSSWNVRVSFPVFIVVLLLLAAGPRLVRSQPPQLIAYKPEGSILQSESSVFVVQANLNSSLLLFGYNITSLTVVKFTLSNGTCDETGSLFGETELAVDGASRLQDVVQARVNVSFPLITEASDLYFCLRDQASSNYVHQGVADWLQLRVEPEETALLPLWFSIISIIILMLLSGTFSGLNLGLMALDPVTLKIVINSGSERQKRRARTIYRVRKHGNYLLCTLLLGNVLVNSTFTILLDELVSGAIAIAGSTLAIVIFGEIIPQAICSRHGLLIGANTIWLTYIFMVLTFPLSFPISIVLHFILGNEVGAVYNRDELLELLQVSQKGADIEDHELKIISGALRYKNKTVADVMTKFEHVFCVDLDGALNFKTIKKIYDSGFSRIPIYESNRENVVGILYLRDLTFIDPDDCTPIKQLKSYYNRDVKWVYENETLEDLLKQFITGHYHMAVVRTVIYPSHGDNYYKTVGIVTLEDIIEEILGREIIDEYDQYEDNVTLKPRIRSQMDVEDESKLEEFYTSPTISLSAPQLLAVKQFLSTSVECFSERYITKPILHRLLQQDIVFAISGEDRNFALYQPNTPASYFTLLLEGCLSVEIGRDGLVFEARGFYHFGEQVLLDAVRSESTTLMESLAYLPDFTVRPVTNCLVVIITRRRFLAACRASKFEKSSREGGPNGDYFAQVWQDAEQTDLEASVHDQAGLRAITRLLQTKPLQAMRLRKRTTLTGFGRGDEPRTDEQEGRTQADHESSSSTSGEDLAHAFSVRLLSSYERIGSPLRTSPSRSEKESCV